MVCRGQDLEGAEPLLTQLEASERYQHAVDEWLWETPDTSDAVLALIEFAGVIAADKFAGEAMRDSGPVSDEKRRAPPNHSARRGRRMVQ